MKKIFYLLSNGKGSYRIILDCELSINLSKYPDYYKTHSHALTLAECQALVSNLKESHTYKNGNP